MIPGSQLPNRWRTIAEEFRRYGVELQATTLETCAAELESEEREYFLEELTVQEAAAEMDTSYETMGRRLRRGDIPNAGQKNRPRVRRIDLMKRADPRTPQPVTDLGEPDIADKVLRSDT